MKSKTWLRRSVLVAGTVLIASGLLFGPTILASGDDSFSGALEKHSLFWFCVT